ncbi:MAG: CoA ester lyase [Chloroflexi bacterium]|nr:CoA ester lyase [Chloroflexota bacterium]
MPAILRRSLLYVPGDREAMLAKAPQRGADGLILNLEDAVAAIYKELARETVARALQTVDFGPAEVIVRINGLETDTGYRDLLAIAALGPHAILLPKTRSVEEVRFAAWTIGRLESLHGAAADAIAIMCMIESAAGVLAAAEIAACHPRVTALVFGAADFCAEIGCTPAADDLALLHALNQVVLAARAAGIDAIDAPHMRLDDPAGLARGAEIARNLGFAGKSAIHPAQIAAINAAFSPTTEQIIWARRVIEALGDDEARAGATLLDNQLIETPHLRRARRILAADRRAA